MDWNAAIEKNREALKRILALIVAMAALPVLRARGDAAILPRHLHRAVLRLLRPLEAAARRLIVVAARGLTIQLAPPRKRRPAILPKGSSSTGVVDTGLSLFRLGLANFVPPIACKPRDPSRPLALPLTDTLRGLPRRWRSAATSVPRIFSGASSAARH